VAPTQDEVFRGSESDNYHRRNRDRLLDPGCDVPLRLLDLFAVAPHRVLEIGAGDGQRLSCLVARHGCEAVAIEPSHEAREAGRKRDPAIRFLDGTAATIPSEIGLFDLVIVHFVLHWIDRTTLAASIAAIEQCVEPGGLLVVGDFLPRQPTTVRYHHRDDDSLFTFKDDYAARFLATGRWDVEALLTGAHGGRLELGVPDPERCGWALLRRRDDG